MPPSATFTFPQGFLWGSATSSHQVEGNNTNNNWSVWEQETGRIKNGDKAGLACNWWGGRWKEDLDRAAETGQNAHRFSIEWSRVQPEPERWDEHALDHYRSILRGMYERRLTPMVTLHHFSDPIWFCELGGWENPEAPAYFEKYVRKTVEALKEFTSLWLTINEPNVYVYGGYQGADFHQGRMIQAALSRYYTTWYADTRQHTMRYTKFKKKPGWAPASITAVSPPNAAGSRWIL